VKNPEIIPKEYGWIICTFAGCLAIPFTLCVLPWWFGVFFAGLAAQNLSNAERLLGIRTWRAHSFMGLAVWLVWAAMHGVNRLQLHGFDMKRGKHNYLLALVFLGLALWELICILRRKAG